MKSRRKSIEQEVRSAQQQIPVTLSRTGLNIFSRVMNAEISPGKLIAVICRNLIFYQVQRLCHYDADEQNAVSPAFSAYSESIRQFLLNTDCIDLYLCNKMQKLCDNDVKRIQQSLEHFPKPIKELPEELQMIQKFIQQFKKLWNSTPEKIGFQLYKLQADWINSLCGKNMILLSAGDSLQLAKTEIRRRNSRHENTLQRQIKWGEEFHTYYTGHLANGHCEQTAKRLAREDFINAHPLKHDNEDLDYTNFPGHHRSSLLLYHRTYLKTLKSNSTNDNKEKNK